MEKPIKHVLIFLFLASVLFNSSTFTKILWHNFSDIDDYKIFSGRKLNASQSLLHFPEKINPQHMPEKFDTIPLNDFWWDANK